MPPPPAIIERYLRTHIPLSQAMGVEVVAADAAGVRLCAPLRPNINHRDTAFGGSLSALAILAGWTLVYVRLYALPFRTRIVIQRNTIDYVQPAEEDFCVSCPAPPEADWQRLVEMLKRRFKGRIVLHAEIVSGGVQVGTFEGSYVVFKQAD
jgi:thioesterase domain-containing protein